MSRRIGLTGSIGSGKSTISEVLCGWGFVVLDADKIAHQVTSQPEVLFEIQEAFGSDAVVGGQLDREKLARRVFSNPADLSKLNAIVHPRVRAKMRELSLRETHRVVFEDIPLLFENGLEDQFEAVVFIDAPFELRLERVKERSGWTREELLKREASQWPIAEKRMKTPWLLWNAGDHTTLARDLRTLLVQLGVDFPS
ncbi:MAG: dephospho-CoA kinase [Deinococcaceae bacterium]